MFVTIHSKYRDGLWLGSQRVSEISPHVAQEKRAFHKNSCHKVTASCLNLRQYITHELFENGMIHMGKKSFKKKMM